MTYKSWIIAGLLIISLSTIFQNIFDLQFLSPLSRLAANLNLNFYPKPFAGPQIFQIHRDFRIKTKTENGEVRELSLKEIFDIEDGIRVFFYRRAILLATEPGFEKRQEVARRAVHWLICAKPLFKDTKVVEAGYEITPDKKIWFRCQ
jgi:hypothetical protein